MQRQPIGRRGDDQHRQPDEVAHQLVDDLAVLLVELVELDAHAVGQPVERAGAHPGHHARRPRAGPTPGTSKLQRHVLADRQRLRGLEEDAALGQVDRVRDEERAGRAVGDLERDRESRLAAVGHSAAKSFSRMRVELIERVVVDLDACPPAPTSAPGAPWCRRRARASARGRASTPSTAAARRSASCALTSPRSRRTSSSVWRTDSCFCTTRAAARSIAAACLEPEQRAGVAHRQLVAGDEVAHLRAAA